MSLTKEMAGSPARIGAALLRKFSRGPVAPFKSANFNKVPDAGKDADGAHVAIFARSDKHAQARRTADHRRHARFLCRRRAQGRDGGYAARVDIPPPADAAPLGGLKAIPVDYDAVEKDTARVKRRFNEIFQ